MVPIRSDILLGVPLTRDYLDLAARVARRAAGDVEPNPMVGCVLVRGGTVIGIGHHRRYGGLHAEREALIDCHRRGNDPHGAMAFVTLEPCCHHGKQPPCTDALIGAGIARVVYARPDPHTASGGGADVLRQAGIACELSTASLLAMHLSDPFVKRVTTGLPWVIAKWAQTADGCMTTPEGESPWISNAMSLKRVHRLRARVDVIVTGSGTVAIDDPLLTARGARRVRRVARRVVVCGGRDLPDACKLVHTPEGGPVVMVRADPTRHPSPQQRPRYEQRTGLEDSCPCTPTNNPVSPQNGHSGLGYPSVERLCVPSEGDRVDLKAMLRQLAERYEATNVMLECGPTLLAAFLAAELVDEALVHVAPRDADGSRGSRRPDAPAEVALEGLDLVRTKPLRGDVERWYRRRLICR